LTVDHITNAVRSKRTDKLDYFEGEQLGSLFECFFHA